MADTRIVLTITPDGDSCGPCSWLADYKGYHGTNDCQLFGVDVLPGDRRPPECIAAEVPSLPPLPVPVGAGTCRCGSTVCNCDPAVR